jgi:hypothetical protein
MTRTLRLMFLATLSFCFAATHEAQASLSSQSQIAPVQHGAAPMPKPPQRTSTGR